MQMCKWGKKGGSGVSSFLMESFPRHFILLYAECLEYAVPAKKMAKKPASFKCVVALVKVRSCRQLDIYELLVPCKIGLRIFCRLLHFISSRIARWKCPLRCFFMRNLTFTIHVCTRYTSNTGMLEKLSNFLERRFWLKISFPRAGQCPVNFIIYF